MKRIGTNIAKGAVWMVMAKLIARSIGFISMIILARLLSPSDFGLIAMAMSIVAMLELLSGFGFDMALIQKQNIDRSHYDTAWTFNVILKTASALILLLMADKAANFYNEPRLGDIIKWLALGVFVLGFSNIGTVAFRKEFQFHKEFKFLVSTKVVGFLVTIPLAVILSSYWALIWGMVATKIAHFLFSYYFHGYRPRFDLSATKELFGYSVWLFLNNILFFLRVRSAHFLIGKLGGAYPLGVFTLSYEIANLTTTELIAPINRAVFPGYAKVSSQVSLLRENFLGVISLITLFALPAGMGINALAEPIVNVVLGEKWTDATPIIGILAIFGVLTALQSNSLYVFLAIDKPRISTYISITYVLILFPILYWGVSEFGIVGGAWAYLITASVILPLNYILISKYLDIKLVQIFHALWRPIVAAGVMSFLISQLLQVIPSLHVVWGELFNLVMLIILGAVTYVFVIVVFWNLCGQPKGAEYSVLEKLVPRIPVLSRLYFLNPKD